MRTGVIVKKLGMSSYFSESGDKVPVTLLQMQDCQVVSHVTKARNGYDALVIGSEDISLNKVSKPMKTVFANAKVKPKRFLREFRVEANAFIDVGTQLDVRHFIEGQLVDVSGISIGKGFAGGMKRHNFRGLEATHGVSVSHRSHGSTGACQDPGRVFKNKKMAGHLGNEMVTKQNLKVVAVDPESGVIIVKGGVPGSTGAMLTIRDSVKVGMPVNAPYPTFAPQAVTNAGNASEQVN
jgi:large subunit ribosomal protein L3